MESDVVGGQGMKESFGPRRRSLMEFHCSFWNCSFSLRHYLQMKRGRCTINSTAWMLQLVKFFAPKPLTWYTSSAGESRETKKPQSSRSLTAPYQSWNWISDLRSYFSWTWRMNLSLPLIPRTLLTSFFPNLPPDQIPRLPAFLFLRLWWKWEWRDEFIVNSSFSH